MHAFRKWLGLLWLQLVLSGCVIVLGSRTASGDSGAIYFVDCYGIQRASLDDFSVVTFLPGVPEGCLECAFVDVRILPALNSLFTTIVCPTRPTSILVWDQWDDLGLGVEVIVFEAPHGMLRCTDFDPVGQKAYWTLSVGYPAASSIQRSNLDGSDIETIVTDDGTNIGGLLIDSVSGTLYWSSFDPMATGGSIHRADLDGQNRVELVTGLSRPGELALHSGTVFWTDRIAGKIQSADAETGQDVEDIVTGLENPLGLDIDEEGGKLYWSSSTSSVNNGKIQCANLDGSAIQDLVGGLDSVGRLDVAREVPSNVGANAPTRFSLASHTSTNGSIVFVLEIPYDGWVKAELFSVAGRRVRSLVDAYHPRGRHVIDWRGDDDRGNPVASGVYFLRADTELESRVTKAILVK